MVIRKNTKGFTVIELVLSFSLVSILSIGLFATVMNYRNKQQVEEIKAELYSYRSKIVMEVQNDIEQKILKNADYCTYVDSLGVTRNDTKCVNFNFRDGSSKVLKLVAEKKSEKERLGEDEFDVYENYILYGDVKYTTSEKYNIVFGNDFFLDKTTERDGLENNTDIYRVRISMNHQDLKEPVNIDIVAVGTNKYNASNSYLSYNIGEVVKIQLRGDLQRNFYVIKSSSSSQSKLVLLSKDVLSDVQFNSLDSTNNEFEGSSIQNSLKSLGWTTPDAIRLLNASEISIISSNIYPYFVQAPYEEVSGKIPLISGYLATGNYWTNTKVKLASGDSDMIWVVEGGRLSVKSVDSVSGLRPVIEIDKKYVTSVK